MNVAGWFSDSFREGDVISQVEFNQGGMSAQQRRAAIATVLARGVVRWRAGLLKRDLGVAAERDADEQPVSEISGDSLAERLDPRSVPSLSVNGGR